MILYRLEACQQLINLVKLDRVPLNNTSINITGLSKKINSFASCSYINKSFHLKPTLSIVIVPDCYFIYY